MVNKGIVQNPLNIINPFNHQMSSQNEKPYKCAKCEVYSFNSKEELTQHGMEHHPE
ncbi:MAG: hypothetical protein WKF36_10240 [Candidatus Nitrosocosmicus sp.]